MKEHHGPEKKWRVWAVSALSVLLAVLLGLAWHYCGSRLMANMYFAGGDVDRLFHVMHDEKAMFDPALVRKYEAAYLGNDNANLQMYGYYCRRGDVICKAEEQTVLIRGEDEIVIDQDPAKYINIWNGVVYYRSDADRRVYAYDIAAARKTCLIDAACGQMAVSAAGISYIDLATSQLMYLPWQSDGPAEPVSDMRIKSFAVLGDAYLCLDTQENLGMLQRNGSFTQMDDEVERFLYNGRIFLQKGSNILCMSGRDRVRSVGWNCGILVGVDADHFFVNEGERLVRYSASDHMEETQIYTFEITTVVKYFCAAGDTYILTLCDRVDGMYETEHVTLDRVAAAP